MASSFPFESDQSIDSLDLGLEMHASFHREQYQHFRALAEVKKFLDSTISVERIFIAVHVESRDPGATSRRRGQEWVCSSGQGHVLERRTQRSASMLQVRMP